MQEKFKQFAAEKDPEIYEAKL